MAIPVLQYKSVLTQELKLGWVYGLIHREVCVIGLGGLVPRGKFVPGLGWVVMLWYVIISSK